MLKNVQEIGGGRAEISSGVNGLMTKPKEFANLQRKTPDLQKFLEDILNFQDIPGIPGTTWTQLIIYNTSIIIKHHQPTWHIEQIK